MPAENLANRLRIAALCARHPRIAKAMALRRSAELLLRARPRLVLPHPVELVVAVESACQLKCSMCGIRKVMKRPQFIGTRISRADLFPALFEAARWRPSPYVKLTGGEPLLLGDDLLGMLRDARSLGLASRLSTNGVLLADYALAREVVKTGVDVITISIDGPREIHNGIRGRNFAFDKSTQGLMNLAAARRGLGQAGPLIMVSTVISPDNHLAVEDLFKEVKRLGIDWWNIQLINYVSSSAKTEADAMSEKFGFPPGAWDAFVNESVDRIDSLALSRQIAKIKRVRKNFAVSFLDAGGFSAEKLAAYHSGSGKPLSDRACVAPRLAMHVVPSGDMVFCIDYPHVAYGNIRTTGLADAWRSETAGRYRRYLHECRKLTGTNPPQCSRCNWLFN